MAFDQRGYKAVARACDQVTLPVPWYGAIFDIRAPLSDRYRIPNLAEAAALQGGMSLTDGWIVSPSAEKCQ